MRRSLSAKLALTMGVAMCCSGQAHSADSKNIGALANEYAALRVSYDPTIAYSTGLEAPDHERFADRSPQAIRSFERKEDSLLARLDRIPSASVPPADKATYAVLREMLEASRQLRVCRLEYWDVSHLTGWQHSFALIAQRQPVGDAKLRVQALARWGSLPDYLDVQIANLRTGLRARYSVPKSVVRRVIQQLDGLLSAAAENSPFFSPAARDSDAAFKQTFHSLLEKRVQPAIRKYRDFLANEYLPRARDTLALSALPDGARCYQAQLRNYTTLNRSAAEVYALGEKTVAENAATVIELGSRLYGTQDLTAIIRRTSEAPDNHFSSADEYLAYANEMLKHAIERVQPLFTKLPQQRVVIEPFPAYEIGSGVAAHYDTEPNVSKPAKYMIPLENWKSETRGGAEIAVVHEALPGHHLQIATALELPQRSQIAKIADNSAYIEGWARYAERLSEEGGIYQTDYARIVRRIWPARGMVVDPGIHAFGWTRERAVAYLKSTGRFDDATANATVDRIATTPGQLTAYDSGGLEIFALRKEAQDALGASFDLRGFHQSVLEEGAVPLLELRQHVRTWIAAERVKTAR